MKRVLVVDDDPNTQRALRKLLNAEGFAVECVTDGKAALEVLDRYLPAVVVLELRLPGISGIDLCGRIKRRFPNLPLLVLSGRTEVTEKVLLLELGADDYVTKPFNSEELMARLKACLRRGGQPRKTDRFVFEDVVIDFSNLTITRAGRPIQLTAKQFEILKLLVNNEDRVISRENLIHQLQSHDLGIGRALDNQICRLRHKLEIDPKHPAHLRTIQRIGYKFVR